VAVVNYSDDYYDWWARKINKNKFPGKGSN
jgi:hypothetical protein